jgi:hypothetical protein
MKLILALLAALCLLAAAAQAQTIKTLGYNTTNGEVVYSGTNALLFTNEVSFLGTANAANFAANGSISVADGTNNFFVAGDDIVEFLVPIQIENSTGLAFGGTNAATAAAATRTNLGLYNTNAPAAFAALALWDEVNEEIGLRVVDDEIRVTSFLIGTNAPTDTTNVVKWIRVVEGTNSYRVPLYQ